MNVEKYAERMILEGMAAKDIADCIGCPVTSVYAVARRRGLNIRKSSVLEPVLKQHHDEIQRDIYNGSTIKEIADKFGVSYTTAKRYVRNYIDYPEELKQANINRAVELNRNTEAEVRAKIAQANQFIEYVGGYTRKQEPVTVQCLVCGQTYEMNFNTIVHNGGGNCPHCKEAERIEREQQREQQREQRRQVEAEERERKRLLARLTKILETKAKQDERWHDCPVCGKRTNRPKYCSDRCRKRAENKRSEVVRRTRIAEQMIDNDITLEGLFKRDKGVCHICGGKCDYEDYVVTDQTIICGDWYPSIDHVVPLSKGGEHSWKNIKLAHRICNTKKYNR